MICEEETSDEATTCEHRVRNMSLLPQYSLISPESERIEQRLEQRQLDLSRDLRDLNKRLERLEQET